MTDSFLQYQLLKPLGSGGSAQVWRASRIGGTDVAIKLFAEQMRSESAEMLRGEAERIARLHHRRIVNVVDTGSLAHDVAEFPAGTSYIVMDWVDGPTLDTSFAPDWAWVESVTLQLLDALAAAHAHNIIHLDVKPSNVLMRRVDPPDVVLVDFGIAHRFEYELRESDVHRPLAGTPGYMAPEQIIKETANFGPWTDIYALGCLVVELCTGRPPFIGPTVDVLRKHLEVRPPPLASRFAVPSDLQDWLDRCLAKGAKDRFERAADAAWAFAQLSRDFAAQGQPEGSGDGSLAGTVVPDAQTITWIRADLLTTAPVSPRVSPTGDTLKSEPSLRTFERPGFPARWYVDADLHQSVFAPLLDYRTTIDQIWQSMHEAYYANEPRGILLTGGDRETRYELLRVTCTRALALGVSAYFLVRPGTDQKRAAERMLAQVFRLGFFDSETDAGEYCHGILDALSSHRVVSDDLRETTVEVVLSIFRNDSHALPAATARHVCAEFLARFRRIPMTMFDGADEDPEMMELAATLIKHPTCGGTGAAVIVAAQHVDTRALRAFADQKNVLHLHLDR